MRKHFNTTGPCLADRHYMLSATERLPDAREAVVKGAYFVVHAPRQTGKTTTLRALARELTASGDYAALHFSCEAGSPFSHDPQEVQSAMLFEMRRQARMNLPEELHPPPWPTSPSSMMLISGLSEWAYHCPRPLVLFLDEIDSLYGESLVSVLRQLRTLFPDRPAGAPAAIALCGLRDVRDYKLASGGQPPRPNSPSPFNIKYTSLRLGDFSFSETTNLYAQHTAETGQVFAPDAIERAFELSKGQPWLVNALANEIVDEMRITETITAAHVDTARDRLILARATHIDQLTDKLRDPRVQAIIEPIVAGDMQFDQHAHADDVEYVRDLGLIRPKDPLRISNPIYREVMVRELTLPASRVLQLPPHRTFITDDGRLDLATIIREFSAFWVEHGEIVGAGTPYHEVAAQLVLMAYLQRVVNGGGHVDREYGLGRGRIDLLIRWPLPDGGEQREAIELKAWRAKGADPEPTGLEQLDRYLDRLGLDTGLLVVFDRRADAPPAPERTGTHRATTPSGRTVTVLRA